MNDPRVSDRGVSAWLALGEVALSLALFVACVAYIRLRLRPAPAGGTA